MIGVKRDSFTKSKKTSPTCFFVQSFSQVAKLWHYNNMTGQLQRGSWGNINYGVPGTGWYRKISFFRADADVERSSFATQSDNDQRIQQELLLHTRDTVHYAYILCPWKSQSWCQGPGWCGVQLCLTLTENAKRSRDRMVQSSSSLYSHSTAYKTPQRTQFTELTMHN